MAMEAARQREESERMALVVSLWNATTSGLMDSRAVGVAQLEPLEADQRSDDEADEDAPDAEEAAPEEAAPEEESPTEASSDRAEGSSDEDHGRTGSVTRNLGPEINAAG